MTEECTSLFIVSRIMKSDITQHNFSSWTHFVWQKQQKRFLERKKESQKPQQQQQNNNYLFSQQFIAVVELRQFDSGTTFWKHALLSQGQSSVKKPRPKLSLYAKSAALKLKKNLKGPNDVFMQEKLKVVALITLIITSFRNSSCISWRLTLVTCLLLNIIDLLNVHSKLSL
jgi:hypothetical protein